MASDQQETPSAREGQVIKLCEICESEHRLKWKCLDCGLMMCQRCKDKIHHKFGNADHTIIDIREVGTNEADCEPKPDLTKLKCDVHSGQRCCLYCRSCQILVCQTCIADIHKKHEFDEISAEYKRRLGIIKFRQTIVEKDMKTLIKSKDFLKQQKTTRQSHYDKVRQEIFDDEKAILDEVKKHILKLVDDLDLNWEQFSNSIDAKDNELEEKLMKSQERHEEICQLFQPDNTKNVFTITDSFLASVNAKFSLNSLTFNEVTKFNCGDKMRVSQIIGKLEKSTTRYMTDLQIEKQFETELKCISTLASWSDGFLWICDSISRVVQKVKPNDDNSNLRLKASLKIKVKDVVLLPSGDLLLSVGSTNLKQIPVGSTEIQDSVYTVQPLMTTGLHVTRDNMVIVGAIDSQGIGDIIVMDNTGKNKTHFRPRSALSKFLTASLFSNGTGNEYGNAISITSNSQNTIATVSDFSRWTPITKVLMFDMEGNRKSEYTGLDENQFKPKYITTTPSENFIVADGDNQTLHILNNKGEIITLFDTQKKGILLPYSLTFSTSGQLYIGCGTKRDTTENAKIFEIGDLYY